MGNLTAQMVREHPALTDFQRYIQEHTHRAPNPQDIIFSNEVPSDGIIELSYLDPNGEVFAGQIDASHQQALGLRHGRVRSADQVTWAGDVEYRATSDACRTVHTLGGPEESSFQCPSAPATNHPDNVNSGDIFWPRASWLGANAFANYTGIEFVNFIRRRLFRSKAWHAQSPTEYLFRNGRAWMSPTGSNELSFTQRLGGYGSVVGVGAITMLSADYGSDLLGLHPDFHANERFAISAYSAYGAMSGMTSWLNRGRPAGTRLAAPTLVSGLISSALVDATLGRMWQEGSSERQALRMGAFFLPQLYRMAFGNRSLALAETRAARGFTRWGGRAVAAGFYADAAYMIYDHATHSNRETARSNLIYRRASQLQDQNAHPLTWAFNGAVRMIAPSLAERFLTPSSYVNQAQTELDAQGSEAAQRLRGYLGRALLMGPNGPATEASFYTELNWDWLRGDSSLGTIRRNGRELPVDLVAEQLSDPEIHRQVIENSSPDQRIAYIQRQFRGYDLSRAEVEEIFARIEQHNARQELRSLYYSAGPHVAALSDCFDENGSLRAGREGDLLTQIFPSQAVNAEQVLALRRVALARRILELRQSDPAGELAAYDRVARQIGLVDAGGNLVGDETRLAQASLESQPAAPIPAARPAVTPANVIQGIMAYGAGAHG